MNMFVLFLRFDAKSLVQNDHFMLGFNAKTGKYIMFWCADIIQNMNNNIDVNYIFNIMRQCPRWNKCSVNNCPLHHEYPDLIVNDDENSICTLGKNRRYSIGSKYPDILKYQGLTPREWMGKINYDNKSEEEKMKMAESCRVGREVLKKKKEIEG